MKLNTIPKPALTLLITGLLMTTLTPAISRYYLMPDFVKGFITGLGLTLELIGLIKMQRSKKAGKCAGM
jgi:hypothetical protein